MQAINQYSNRGRILDSGQLFGRKRELGEVFNLLETIQKRFDNWPTRIGKSSFLNRIAHPKSDELPILFNASSSIHYLDLQRVFSAMEFYERTRSWGWSNEQQRIALSLLAEVEGEASFAIIEKHLGREAALEATRKLVGRDILSERTGETGDLVFRFQIPLAQMWVRRMKPSARILMEGGKQ